MLSERDKQLFALEVLTIQCRDLKRSIERNHFLTGKRDSFQQQRLTILLNQLYLKELELFYSFRRRPLLNISEIRLLLSRETQMMDSILSGTVETADAVSERKPTSKGPVSFTPEDMADAYLQAQGDMVKAAGILGCSLQMMQRTAYYIDLLPEDAAGYLIEKQARARRAAKLRHRATRLQKERLERQAYWQASGLKPDGWRDSPKN